MNKLMNYLIGPELLWVIFYAFTVVVVKATNSPVKTMDSFWANTGFWVPLLLVPLTFMLYYIPAVQQNWLLLRIWIAVIIGGHYVVSKCLNAHSEGGPGVGTIYIMAMGFVIVLLIAGSIFAWIKFR